MEYNELQIAQIEDCINKAYANFMDRDKVSEAIYELAEKLLRKNDGADEE